MTIDHSSLEDCQQVLGYHFNNVDLLRQSLIHASVASQRAASNERLEFLGDAILGMVICHELYTRFPSYLEGELTKIKSMLVSRRTCAKIADDLGLGDFLEVGKGMAAQKRIPTSCRAAAFESVIGAIYLDGGEKAAWDFILRCTIDLLEQADANQHQENFKSMLQQYSQRTMDTTPVYEILDEKGPDHSKCFEVRVVIDHRRFASAWGPSKKEAEQLAAYLALQELNVIPADDAQASDTSV
ncbi:MAG: ribonuclease III [Sedimentisphaerales bacterium]|nr:ribonuclease III [Sedimentisphaerales bacterium]